MFTCIEKRLGALALYLQSPIFEGLEKRDPNKAIIAMPRWLRLLYELLLFTIAALMLFNLKTDRWAYIFMIVSILHYVVSYDRVVLVIKQLDDECTFQKLYNIS